MSGQEDSLLELVVAGVLFIIIGPAFAPLLPFDLAVIGWLFLALAVIAAIGIVIAALASVAGKR